MCCSAPGIRGPACAGTTQDRTHPVRSAAPQARLRASLTRSGEAQRNDALQTRDPQSSESVRSRPSLLMVARLCDLTVLRPTGTLAIDRSGDRRTASGHLRGGKDGMNRLAWKAAAMSRRVTPGCDGMPPAVVIPAWVRAGRRSARLVTWGGDPDVLRARILALPARAQEILAAARPPDDGAVRRAGRADARKRGRTLHLHAVLSECGFSASPRCTTTARR